MDTIRQKAIFTDPNGLPVPFRGRLTLHEGWLPLTDLRFGDVTEEGGELLAVATVCSRHMGEMGLALCEDYPINVQCETDKTLPPNGYRVSVCSDGIRLTGADCLGLHMAAETLFKLAKDGKLPLCELEDAPYAQVRGVHISLPSKAQMPFVLRMIKEILVPMGYNTLFLFIGAGMQFDSHPEINKAFTEAVARGRRGEIPMIMHADCGGGTTVSKEDVRFFCWAVGAMGLEVIPEIQSLSHVQWMTVAHPELAERDPDAKEPTMEDVRRGDIRPDRFFPHCYCPSNEKCYEILFDVAEEIIEVVAPTTYVHMGHDEIYEIGKCPVCREKDPADLLAADICRIHRWLAERGLKMMLWADALMPFNKWRTVEAVHRIPKDIVLLDFIWYFHMEEDTEAAYLTDNGFSVLLGNLYSSHFPRFEARIAHPGVLGGEMSTWTRNDEKSLGERGKLIDMLMTGAWLWMGKEDRLNLEACFEEALPTLRRRLRGQTDAPAITVLHRQAPALPTEIPLQGKVKALVLEHTLQKAGECPNLWATFRQIGAIGTYILRYTDGTEESLPLYYSREVAVCSRRPLEPIDDIACRHNGYPACAYLTDGVGRDGKTYYRYAWENPHPEKTLAGLSYIPANEVGESLLLTAVDGEN